MARLRGRVGSLLEVGTGFHPELTGRENIYLNGAILGMKRAEIARKFDEIVAFAEVERFLDTPVKRYSSGMYIRLAFAVAAHLEPEILVVDEVLAVGDVEFQKKCLGKMNEVVGHGRTVLFVSHNTQSIAALTNRCLVLKQGRLILDAPTGQAIKFYIETSLKGSTMGAPYIKEGGDPDSNYIAEARVFTSEPYGQHVWGEPIAFEFVLHVGMPMAKLCFMFCIMDAPGGAHHPVLAHRGGPDLPDQAGGVPVPVRGPQAPPLHGCLQRDRLDHGYSGAGPDRSRVAGLPVRGEHGRIPTQGLAWHEGHSNYIEEAEWLPVAQA